MRSKQCQDTEYDGDDTDDGLEPAQPLGQLLQVLTHGGYAREYAGQKDQSRDQGEYAVQKIAPPQDRHDDRHDPNDGLEPSQPLGQLLEMLAQGGDAVQDAHCQDQTRKYQS